MDKLKSNNSKIIKALIHDIFDMIIKANYDEYYIDLDGKIISKIFENIANILKIKHIWIYNRNI